ncbi:MAG: hypothetical protein Q7S92_05140 [Candidatus Diapherotrites archaeon]|nr:hypothetical protein [Candidatus Diapherotrites archaeon]
MRPFLNRIKRAVPKLRRPRPATKKPVQASPKDSVFSFETKQGWAYADIKPKVINGIIPMLTHYTVLVLRDSAQRPRFVLEYKDTGSALIIHAVQRTRTQYTRVFKWNIWSSKKETQESKQFQKELNGIHPGEFLLTEFLRQNKERIRKGCPVFLRYFWTDHPAQFTSNALRDRFFEHKPTQEQGMSYKLNLNRKRVKTILETSNADD